MERQNIKTFAPIEINYAQFSKKEEALKRKWSEKRESRKLSKSDDLCFKTSPSTVKPSKGAQMAVTTSETVVQPTPSKSSKVTTSPGAESPLDLRRSGLRSSSRKTRNEKGVQSQEKDVSQGCCNVKVGECCTRKTGECCVRRNDECCILKGDFCCIRKSEECCAQKARKFCARSCGKSYIDSKGKCYTEKCEKCYTENCGALCKKSLRKCCLGSDGKCCIEKSGNCCIQNCGECCVQKKIDCCVQKTEKPLNDYPKTSTDFQRKNPSRRASTPVPQQALSDPLSDSYEKFRARLEKPLSRRIHRGAQLGNHWISSHVVMGCAPKKFQQNPDYTWVISFPEKFDLERFEAEENAACTSANWEQLYENHIEHVVYYVPYVYHVPAFYSEAALYYPYVNYHPYYYHPL